jgi:hypothetical protein
MDFDAFDFVQRFSGEIASPQCGQLTSGMFSITNSVAPLP